MILTNKMTQTEQPLEAFYSPSEAQDMPENTGFSALFSSMVSEQEEGSKMEPLSLQDSQNTQEVDALRFNFPSLSPVGGEHSIGEEMEQFSSLNLLNSATVNGDFDTYTPELNHIYLSEESQRLNEDDGQPTSDLTVSQLLNSEVEKSIEGEIPKYNTFMTDPPVDETLNDSLERVLEPVKMGLNSDLESIEREESISQVFDLSSSNTKVEVVNQDVSEQAFIKEAMIVQEEGTLITNVHTENKPSYSVLNQGVTPQGAAVNSSTTTPQGFNQSSTQGMVSWGAQGIDSQASQGFGQQGQPSQNGSGQQAQQQAMMFAQMTQGKQLSLEQQAAVRAIDEAVAKSEGRELLGGAEIASLERKGALPLNLQSINLPVKHPQWGQALGQRIVFMSNSNMQQAQITLNPQKLGQIQVMLQLDKDQQMHVSLVAQNGTTRESMENALPRLREMMEQAGIQLGSVDVSDQKPFSESGDAQNHHEKSSSKHALVEESKMEEQPLLMTGSTDNIIDYYA